MVNGVYLTLMIGPGVPVPAPREIVEAITAIEVQTATGRPSGFSLSFSIAKNSPLLTLFLLSGGSPVPAMRVILVVTLNGVPEVISDGVMTDHDFKAGTAGQPGTLTIKGTDLTALMDLIPFDGLPYPAMPTVARVLAIVAKYAVLGIARKSVV